MDRLTSMAVFVKAVDLGSFAAAADVLELSGPMVGKHVRFLEERLGVRLLTRTTRRQSLTDFGRAYYERCRVVLAEAEVPRAIAEAFRSGNLGVLDYYKLKNVQADTAMRESIAKPDGKS